MGVEGNCCSKSCGGEVDSTGLRTQTATSTPRTRCVPPEALLSAATANIKSAKTGSRQVPRFGICRWERTQEICDHSNRSIEADRAVVDTPMPHSLLGRPSFMFAVAAL